MSFHAKLREYIAAEETDERLNICIFGYYPYFAYRRAHFETALQSIGMARIARKKPLAGDVIKRLFSPFNGVARCDTLYVINRDEHVLAPPVGACVFGYFSDDRAKVRLESMRFLCYLFAPLLAPLYWPRLRRVIGIKEQIQYLGDSLYFLWVGRLLRRTGARWVILSVSYSHYPLIAAARALGISIIEYQHGALSRCHIGYSGPIERYFPDQFIALNPTWERYLTGKSMPFKPVGETDSWLDSRAELDLNTFCARARGKSVLVIGQETVHETLYSVYKQLIAHGVDATYRFHPRMRREAVPLEVQLAEADILVGSYSTVLVEFMDTKEIAIVQSPASEFLDVLEGGLNVYRISIA